MRSACVLLFVGATLVAQDKQRVQPPERKAPGTIQGQVLDQRGKPVVGIKIKPFDSGVWWNARTLTSDRQGRFEFRNQPGNWGFEVDTQRTEGNRPVKIFGRPDLGIFSFFDEAFSFTFHPDKHLGTLRWSRIASGETTKLVVRVPPAYPAGFLVLQGGNPVVGAFVRLHLYEPQSLKPVAMFRGDDRPHATSKEGTAVFPSLYVGRYAPEVVTKRARVWFREKAHTKKAPLDRRLKLGEVVATIELLDAEGSPVKDAAVSVSDRWSTYSVHVSSSRGPDGVDALTVPFLRAGEFDVTAFVGLKVYVAGTLVIGKNAALVTQKFELPANGRSMFGVK